jgi:hypothetical protein
MTLSCAVVGLAVLTLLVALYSEYLVDSMDGFAKATNLSQTFIGSKHTSTRSYTPFLVIHSASAGLLRTLLCCAVML